MDILNEATNWFKTSITLKLLMIGFLILILLIPANMIQSLISERGERRKEVVNEVTYKWGNPFELTGPVLTVPYKVYAEQNGKMNEFTEYAHFLPDGLTITGNIDPITRKRSIYKVILYNAGLNVKGTFKKPDFAGLNINEQNVLWNDASITIGIPDMRGIKKNVEIKWNNENSVADPGVMYKQLVQSGLHSKVKIDSITQKYDFSFNLDVNGSESVRFIPLGKETSVALTSKWTSPSYNGAFLPTRYTLDKTGFTAKWNILYLNRNYPQQWTDSDHHDLSESSFGVDLLLPVDHYQKSTRSAKYAVMFLFLTFLLFFIYELISKSRIHPVQYLLIGLALIIFYTLLVSLSEYLGFNLAYLIASLAIITLLSTFANSAIKKRNSGLIFGAFLALLYGFLFVLLQLEDYALLMGSIGLFIIIATALFGSRKIDWYSPLTTT